MKEDDLYGMNNKNIDEWLNDTMNGKFAGGMNTLTDADGQYCGFAA